MSNYLDKILYLYPDIQRVAYWATKYDGTPWADPYDGIVWENKVLAKPAKEVLDAVTDEMILAAKPAPATPKEIVAAKYPELVALLKLKGIDLTQ